MKLNELGYLVETETLDVDGYFIYKHDIVKWMTSNGVLPEHYTISSHDLQVTIARQNIMVNLNSDHISGKILTRLPVKFADINCTVKLNMPYLKTLRGMSDDIVGTLDLSECTYLESFDGYPARVGCNLVMPKTTKSLVGISKHVKEVGYTLNTRSNPYMPFRCNFDNITEGGIELIQIQGLDNLRNLNGTLVGVAAFLNGIADEITPWSIIEKYLGKPNEIFDCQSELINAGFEEYAKL